jgi:hypothetical protein
MGNQATQRFSQRYHLTSPNKNYCAFDDIYQTCQAQILTKLTIGEPGDKYEQEADRVADHIIQITEPRDSKKNTGAKNASSLITHANYRFNVENFCKHPLEEDNDILQAKKRASAVTNVAPTLQTRIESLKGGTPLSKSERNFFEPIFGVNLSDLRLHTDNRAVKIARTINARAFTFGHNIGFNYNEYDSKSINGIKLLAHEIVHTIQQKDASLNLVQPKDLPGGLTTDGISSTCFDFEVLSRQMEDEVLFELYESLLDYYTMRDREQMPEQEAETIKDNIRGLREILEELNIGPYAASRSLQAGIVQAKFKTPSPESIYRLDANAIPQRLMRAPVPEAEQPTVDAETLAEIETENPYQGTRVQEITRAPGLFGRIPLPIPYNQIDPTTVNIVDIWGLGCGPCQRIAERIIAISQMSEFRNVRFYHVCRDRFPSLLLDYIPQVFVLLGQNLRFQWDNLSNFDTWLVSKLRLFI